MSRDFIEKCVKIQVIIFAYAPKETMMVSHPHCLLSLITHIRKLVKYLTDFTIQVCGIDYHHSSYYFITQFLYV